MLQKRITAESKSGDTFCRVISSEFSLPINEKLFYLAQAIEGLERFQTESDLLAVVSRHSAGLNEQISVIKFDPDDPQASEFVSVGEHRTPQHNRARMALTAIPHALQQKQAIADYTTAYCLQKRMLCKVDAVVGGHRYIYDRILIPTVIKGETYLVSAFWNDQRADGAVINQNALATDQKKKSRGTAKKAVRSTPVSDR
jgi:hypothetical protein